MVEHRHTDAPDTQGAHLELLSLIEQHPEYSQRRLAQTMGISLGKTHYLLKALFDKGLVKAGNFRRSDSKLSYLYVLTPAGVRHRLQLTQSFLVRKEREFVLLRAEIDRLRATLAQQPAVSHSPDTVS
jgi:EPS-associated MarR family transcriptional regulator